MCLYSVAHTHAHCAWGGIPVTLDFHLWRWLEHRGVSVCLQWGSCSGYDVFMIINQLVASSNTHYYYTHTHTQTHTCTHTHIISARYVLASLECASPVSWWLPSSMFSAVTSQLLALLTEVAQVGLARVIFFLIWVWPTEQWEHLHSTDTCTVCEAYGVWWSVVTLYVAFQALMMATCTAS